MSQSTHANSSPTPAVVAPVHLTSERLRSAHARVLKQLLDQRGDGGHWTGELSASALSTATAISALSFYLKSDLATAELEKTIRAQIDSGITWLMLGQNRDGGWGDTDKSYSNISTSMLVIAALAAADVEANYPSEIQRAWQYVKGQGGVDGIRKRYGQDKTFAVPILANCAMAGLVEWSEVSALPFEAACVPQRFYHLMNLPVVSYAIPALVAIGQAKFINDPPRNPVMRLIRRCSIQRSLKVLDRIQPASGGFLEAVPLTSFVCMALINSGQSDRAVVANGIRFIIESFRPEKVGGSWPIDTNLAMWTTTLAVNGVAESSLGESMSLTERRSCLSWILDCQYKDVHPFTGAAPGGWGWSDLSGAVPDADDTPGALLALRKFYDSGEFEPGEKEKMIGSAKDGIHWLIGLQNRDKGWPTFCRGWGRLPFDRSGADITAHVVRSLIAWKPEFQDDSIVRSVTKAIEHGFQYLEKHQQADGSWLPLWFGNQDYLDDTNPYYGTSKVLLAYRDAKRFDTKGAEIGLRWIRENQNPDGGWGGGPAVVESLRSEDPASLGISTVEETALCVETLLDATDQQSRDAAKLGLEWLVRAVESDSIHESWPIGFYFAKLWYSEKLYPLIFATSALGRAQSKEPFQD